MAYPEKRYCLQKGHRRAVESLWPVGGAGSRVERERNGREQEQERLRARLGKNIFWCRVGRVRPHTAMLKDYSWVFAKGSILVLLNRPYAVLETELGSIYYR